MGLGASADGSSISISNSASSDPIASPSDNADSFPSSFRPSKLLFVVVLTIVFEEFVGSGTSESSLSLFEVMVSAVGVRCEGGCELGRRRMFEVASDADGSTRLLADRRDD